MRLEGRYPEEYRYQGFELEEACIGHKINWKNILEKKRVSEENLSYKKLFETYKELYPLNPQLPEKKWGRDLFNFTAENLELDLEDPKELKFINVLGSRLDKKGVDCFFSFKNPKTEKEAIFTIDLTSNPKKDEARADLIINEFPDHRSDSEQYIEKMEEASKKIAEGLKNKTELIH